MADTKVFSFPESGNGNDLATLLALNGNNNGGFLGGNGWGGGILGFLLGLMFGNGGFGGFGNFGGGNNGAGFLANQLNNNNGRDLLMQAITSNGEQSRQAIQTLSTKLRQDFNLVNSNVQTISSAVNSIANAQGVNALQIVNAIQAGNASLAAQLCQCCCENRAAVMQQGYEAQIRTLEQTNQLGSQADRNNNAVIGAINAQTVAMNDQFCALKERELQSKIDTQADIITQLRGQIDNANQTAAITGYVNSVVAPLQAKVGEIANKMPQTVPVQWPQLTAVNTTPYVNGGFYGNGYYGGNGFGGNIIF